MTIYQYLLNASIGCINENPHCTIESYTSDMFYEQIPNVYLFCNNDNKTSVNIIVTESMAYINLDGMEFAVRSNCAIGSYLALRRYVGSVIGVDIEKITNHRYGTDEDSALSACEEINDFLGDCQEKSSISANMRLINVLSDAFKQRRYAFYELDRRIVYVLETKRIHEHAAYIFDKNGFNNFIEPCLPTISKYFEIVFSEDEDNVMISLLSR